MPDDSSRFTAYDGLATPTVILDADYRITYVNDSARRFWAASGQEFLGQLPVAALRLSAPDGADVAAWSRDVVFPAIAAGDPFTCRVRGGGPVQLRGTRFVDGGERFVLLSVVPEAETDGTPAWALTDPLTGLWNRHQWERAFIQWNARPGAVIFLDLDNLKQINDLYGHRRGDQALGLVGDAISAHLPADDLAVRYGGDEFVVLLRTTDAAEAEGVGARIAAEVDERAARQAPDIPLHVSWGVAPYTAGHLAPGVDAADQALYARKGVLLASSRGGRIVLTKDAHGRLLSAASEQMGNAPGEFSKRFGNEFNESFRQAYARSVAQAREFIDFVSPTAGSAVVEIGAGPGRITFDGGLAERVGREGQLLVTDPSPAQLQAARQRAAALGLDWIHFLAAPAEDLPVASHTVDLVVGAYFLHYTNEAASIRSAARVLRPGGRLALSVGLNARWGPAWERRAFAPIREALAAHGLPWRPVFLPQQELEDLIRSAGLVIERFAVAEGEQLTVPSAEALMAMARQTRLAAVLARALPPSVQAKVESASLTALQQAMDELGPQAAGMEFGLMSLVAHKEA